MTSKKKNTTILHFHTDFLHIPQFQLLSISRWLAETGVSWWEIVVTSCLIRPLQHHDVWRHFNTDCGTPYNQKKHPNAHKQMITKTRIQKKTKYTGVFQHSVPGWGLLPWKRFAYKSPAKSTVILRSPTEEGRPFCSLAQEPVSVTAKHSSASRHRRGFTGSARIQLSPRWLLRESCRLLLQR